MLRELDLALLHTTSPPKIPWVVQGLIARGALTLLVGDGGLGKSLFSLAAASCVTQGEYVAGFATDRRRVVIIDAENGEDEIHRRVVKFGLKSNARVFEAKGFDLSQSQSRLADVMADPAVGLVVLDSLSSMWGGDENDRSAVQAVLEPVRELAQTYDCGVLLLHHTNKAGNVFRGSGAMKNVPEIMAMMGQGYMGRRDKNPHRRWIKWEKCRMGRAPSRQWFEFMEDGRLMESRAPKTEELWPRDL